MRLTRRDALAVLAGLGLVSGGAALVETFDPPTADGQRESANVDTVATMVAAGEVVYPNGVEGVDEFVETYVLGRASDDDRESGFSETAADLDAVARDWHDAPFAELDAETRDTLLRQLGTPTADPVPDGTLSERIRFHVVNELLYAFYASPTGGELVGIENPIGYGGGTESYRRASMDERAVDGGVSDEVDDA
ncbi:gluconate 2-dehydrogenase subunit 3 family protein [Haloferax namakaokahaiae]|uniref:Gluconate 2-dehydrogenase subunit 3 family protein n=1 Tax=Haloferax namakaokahaiae TaxID=1748331 RepID=A0ABD5ZF14_9EURY